jgi:catechol 2,3-dioxygenase-like lactoylglutathione lyase family enzyme
MKVTRVFHASVNVEGRLDESVRFYREVLGLADERRPEIPGVAGHWFSLGDAQLHLVDADAGPGPIRPTGHHVCVAVDDLDAAVAQLEAAGIDYVRGAQPGGRLGDEDDEVVQIWITDPAGNTVELQQSR